MFLPKIPAHRPRSQRTTRNADSDGHHRNLAPQFFTRFDEGGYSYVFRQPVGAEEVAQAEEARISCPTDTIGSDGTG
jgi:ferredoxin